MSPVVGVNVRGLSRYTVGVVPEVFATMNRSSTFPADFPIIRILYQKSPDHPRFASVFCPTDVITVDVTIFVVVHHVVMFHSSARDGANSVVAPAPNVPPSHGFTARPCDFVTKFHLFRTVFETS